MTDPKRTDAADSPPGRPDEDSWRDLSASRPPPMPEPSAPPEIRGRLKAARLLVVDDDPARLDAVATAMRKLGLDVAVGDRGESGYRQALRIKPDAVISDLVSPGEPGWWLVQRLHRHPVLRWTPVLLMRLVERAAGGEERVVLHRAIERLSDAFGPLEVLAERIAAGRPLSDRVEVMGIPMLLRVLAAASLDGRLSVNDSWNAFDTDLRGGEVVSVARRGVDGTEDHGERAFLQLVLCEAGRWSFQPVSTQGVPANLPSGLEGSLDSAIRVLGDLFGPEARVRAGEADALAVRPAVLAAAARSLPPDSSRVANAILEGAAGAEIESLVAEPEGTVQAERALAALFRCGALMPLSGIPSRERDPAERRIAETAATFLALVAADHRWERRQIAVPEIKGPVHVMSDGDAATRGRTRPGALYHVRETRVDHVPARATDLAGAAVAGTDAPRTAPLDREARPEPFAGPRPEEGAGPPRDVLASGGGAALPVAAGPAFGVRPHESLAPPPRNVPDAGAGRRQMWLALLLAIALGIGLVVTLAVVGSDERPPAAGTGTQD